MVGLLGYAAAGAAEGFGEGLVAQAKAEREERLRELIHGQRKEITQMGIDARMQEGEADRQSRAELQAQQIEARRSEGAADRAMRENIAGVKAEERAQNQQYRQTKDVNDLAVKLWEADQQSFAGDRRYESYDDALAEAQQRLGGAGAETSTGPAPGGGTGAPGGGLAPRSDGGAATNSAIMDMAPQPSERGYAPEQPKRALPPMPQIGPNDREKYEALEPGTLFIGPDGRVRRKPGQIQGYGS